MYRAIANNINDGQAAPDSHLPCSPNTVLTLLPVGFLAPKTTAHKASFAIISSLCCCWSSSCLWCSSTTRRCVSWLDLISTWSLGPCTSMDTNRLSVSMAVGTHALPLPLPHVPVTSCCYYCCYGLYRLHLRDTLVSPRYCHNQSITAKTTTDDHISIVQPDNMQAETLQDIYNDDNDDLHELSRDTQQDGGPLLPIYVLSLRHTPHDILTMTLQ